MKRLLVGLLVLLSIPVLARNTITYTSVEKCINDSFATDGRNIEPRAKAKEYCLSDKVNISYTSVEECIDDSFATDGRNMEPKAKARIFCLNL